MNWKNWRNSKNASARYVASYIHSAEVHLGNNFCVCIDSVRSEEMAEHRGPGKTCETERFQ